ncbi:MAG: bifunctional folylpolyglutamate synthase/dihydrofolate synthase [Bacteroidia bacterium]|nr:bifunctional folylpolyglutamate synthase/dihydrofolate synthase [Bacteroidia bacterium]
MNYLETLNYLYQQLPLFTRIGAAAYKVDITNTVELCNALNNPQNNFKTIHIAGTNGKGSTSHLLASILQESGLKVGLYTSPHLKDFRERIKINGEMIAEQEIIDFVANHQTLFDAIEPSFFEWTVALCFDYFAKQNIDIAIIETGLGGRLDSTNIINPLLSIITNIGWDHTDLLGDSLSKIAFEKAGIIKKNTPVVIGEKQLEIDEVFRKKALDENSNLIFAQEQLIVDSFIQKNEGATIKFIPNNIFENEIDLAFKSENYSLNCPLGGLYQQHNFTTVLVACQQLIALEFNISFDHIKEGFLNVVKNTGLMGRWQLLGSNPKIICDTGHNVNGIEYIIQQIAMQKFDKLHLVIGIVKDKDINKILALLPVNAQYYWCKAQLPRALNEIELQMQAKQYNLNGNAFETVTLAFESAKKNASKNDFIFVGGSTFVVAEAL